MSDRVKRCKPILLGALMCFVLAESAAAQEDAVLSRFCYSCHGPRAQEADLRFDRLHQTSPSVEKRSTLEKMLRVVRSGTMPPEGAETPSDDQRAQLVGTIEQQLHQIERETAGEGRATRNRRLTTEEYNHTMQTLFGVDARFDDLLPRDPISAEGYRNDVKRLSLSSLRIEACLDSARRAVERYVRFEGESEPAVRYFIELEDLYYSTAKRYKTRLRAPEPLDAQEYQKRVAANRSSPPQYIDPLGATPAGAVSDDEAWRAAIPKLHQQYLAIPKRLAVGELIIRVRAAGTPGRDGQLPRLRVEAGITLGDGCSIDKRLVGEADVRAPLASPELYEFRIRLEDVPTKGELHEDETFDRLSVFDMDQVFLSNASFDERSVFELGRSAYADLDQGSEEIAGPLANLEERGVNRLHLDSVEIEMLPGVGQANSPYRWTLSRLSGDSPNHGTRSTVSDLLQEFMEAAFRRPITDQEVDAKWELFAQLRSQSLTIEESLRETFASVLVSPSFLFVESTSPPSIDCGEWVRLYRLAARLSYFLWLSPPDRELLERAADGTLAQPETLRHQTERMIADPRSRRFLDSFCRQWLRLDRHANVPVDRQRYPTYDEDLGRATINETLAFFSDVVRSGESVHALIDSDFAFMNDRLARHYGIDLVASGELQKVELPNDSVRGGLLTQASVLTMNSDGVDSHPIRRGVWLLERILHTPPPPPPPQVPGLDEQAPSIRGLTLKERIEQHRQQASCRNCHRQIDPWGIAFEHFDAIGKWREQIDAKDGEVPSQPVDSRAVLPDGHRIAGVKDLKSYLIEEREDQLADSLVHHLLTYALGRRPQYAEQREIHQIREQFKASGYRIDRLLVAITGSELFTASSDLRSDRLSPTQSKVSAEN